MTLPGADPRLSEAIHYLREWSTGMARRWIKFREDAMNAGFQTKPILQLTVEKVEVKVLSGESNTRPSVCVVMNGSDVEIHEAVSSFSFDTKCLVKLGPEVQGAISKMEVALKDKLDMVSRLPDLYGPEALEFKMEAESKKGSGN